MLDPDDEAVKRVGGPTEHEGDADVHLRVLLDHSALEVYIGSGEVLSTRIYRCDGIDNYSWWLKGGGGRCISAVLYLMSLCVYSVEQ